MPVTTSVPHFTWAKQCNAARSRQLLENLITTKIKAINVAITIWKTSQLSADAAERETRAQPSERKPTSTTGWWNGNGSRILVQIRLPQPEISFSPAGSCRLQIVKGQQSPWKDKPGKTAQQVQASLKAFSKVFILITSRHALLSPGLHRGASQMQNVIMGYVSRLYSMKGPHQDLSVAQDSTALFKRHFESLSSGTSFPEEELSLEPEEKQLQAALQALLSLCALETKLWGNCFVLQVPPESEQISTTNRYRNTPVINSAISTCPGVRQSAFLTGQLSHYQHYSDKQIKIRAKQKQGQTLTLIILKRKKIAVPLCARVKPEKEGQLNRGKEPEESKDIV